ncbi:MAG: hypothetical protein ACK566_06825, partial [Bacteroidota bacterium]
IMMVEAEATTKTIELIKNGGPTPNEEVVAQGLDAAKPFIRVLCEAQSTLLGSFLLSQKSTPRRFY